MRIVASILALFILASPVLADKASDVFRSGEKQEKAGHIVRAYLLYAEAAALDPGNKLYRAKTALLKPVAEKIQAKTAALAATSQSEPSPEDDSVTIPPESELESVTAREIADARQALPPAQLKLTSGRFDFHFSGGAKELFNQVAARCGPQAMFDGEYEQTPMKIRFDLNDADCRTALHAAEAASNSFVAPISSKLMLVSQDTPAKRAANEQTMSAVVSVPTALTVQDLTEISQAVKQVTGVEKLAWSAATNEILIRDRVSRVLPARAVIEQLVAHRGGVIIDLRFLQLSNSDILSYGVNLTNTFNILFQPVTNPTLANILSSIANGRNFVINGISASIVASLTKSTARTVLETQVRGVSGKPSTFHVGEKYPILTSAYIGGTTASTAGAYTPPPSFTYQDLGVSLKITPSVSNELVTLEVESEYQLLGASALDGIPILTNRKYAAHVSLRGDEWAVIGGLMDETRDKSVSGTAGLARIPLLGWLFKTQNTEKDLDHIIILMKPYIVGEAPGGEVTPAMGVGSDTRPLSPL